MSKALNFISQRKQPLALSQKNIENILWYVLECYGMILRDGKTYSLSDIMNSHVKPENFLRNKLVDEYLREYVDLFKDKFKTEYIFFDKDTEETYLDKDGKEATDKIDIYIRNAALQDSWSDRRTVYYAVECKRIKTLSDTQKYIREDMIGKFSKRNHTECRLPFEGQLAFIENEEISPHQVAEYINNYLEVRKSSESLLSLIDIHSEQKCSFISKHCRDFDHEKKFNIFHLLLDYSKIVVS